MHLSQKPDKKNSAQVKKEDDSLAENVVFEYEALDEAELDQKPILVAKKRRVRSKKSDKADKDAGLIFKVIDGVKLYECDICGKGNITDRYKLNHHRLIHTELRNFVCEICQHTFKTKEALRGHAKLHEDIYMYCDICDARFKVKHQLRCHMDAIHLGKRDHTCHLCGKSFSRVGTLRVHIKSHLEEKKIVCEHCGFKAMNNGKMQRHMKSHTGERNYACGLCGKLFLYSYNVTAHIKHVHYREKRPITCEEKLICYVCFEVRNQKVFFYKFLIITSHLFFFFCI